MKGFQLTIKLASSRVARGHRVTPRAVRFGCGKHPKRAAAKRAWQRESR
ncbi:MAG: hypothetical protein SNJ75_02355 [Gemmataceae bacterium]